MNQLVDEWCDFCSGKKVFDKSHFSYLFHEENIESYLSIILQYFTNSMELELKIKKVLEEKKKNRVISELSDDMLVTLTNDFFNEQANLINDLDNDIHSAIINDVVITNSSQIKSNADEDIPHYWLFEEFGDLIRSSKIDESDKTYALMESLYNIDNDYYLAWYMAKPIVNIQYTLESYFILWKNSHKVLLLEDSILVSK
ncbi:hypothetical protein GCM10009111_34880 [Colwellia asteriadis]|uniref:Uncharacterized protein n=1 Tax=Colwellia asteriadis TaxID=517723 RepID=A0ABN1LBF3_9GAMM